TMHQLMAATLDRALGEIRAIQHAARSAAGPDAGRSGKRDRRRDGHTAGADAVAEARPVWPMIVLRSPKGWTGPGRVDGVPVEGTWRSHQVPISGARENAGHRRLLEKWLRSYRPQELFDANGAPHPEIAEQAPRGNRRMSANPHANGGLLLRDLDLPDFRDYAVAVPRPATTSSEPTRVLGGFLRDVMARNPETFRLFAPDETESNRLGAVFEATSRAWNAEFLDTDTGLGRDGRV